MLKVKAEARPSPIHGLGLFSCEFIPAGSPVAGWSRETDYSLTPEQWINLPRSLQKFLWTFVWVTEDGVYRGTSDDGRFTNHSDNPNLTWNEEINCSVANRDIIAGEELTEDYSQFDAAWNEYKDELK